MNIRIRHIPLRDQLLNDITLVSRHEEASFALTALRIPALTSTQTVDNRPVNCASPAKRIESRCVINSTPNRELVREGVGELQMRSVVRFRIGQ